jgi:hypothetical protein
MTITEFFENYMFLKSSLAAFNKPCKLQLGDCGEEYEFGIPDEGLFDWMEDDKYKELSYSPSWAAEARLGHPINNLTDLQTVLGDAFPHFTEISENHEVDLYTHGIRFNIWYKHIPLQVELDIYIDGVIC